MSRNLLILSAVYLIFALPLSVIDGRRFRVPVLPVIIGGVALIACRFMLSKAFFPSLEMILLALVSSTLLFFCVKIFTGDWLSADDIVFGAVTAVYCGFYDNLVAAAFAVLIGVLFYLGLSVVQKFRKNPVVLRPLFAIPVIPFVTGGAILTKLLFYVIA